MASLADMKPELTMNFVGTDGSIDLLAACKIALEKKRPKDWHAVVSCVKKAPSQIKDRDDRSWGFTALHYAAFAGHNEVIKAILVQEGAEVDIRDAFGKTALCRAATSCHEQTLKLLLERGADVNAVNDLGRTALHWCAFHHRPLICKQLVEAGAKADAKDAEGKTPLELAQAAPKRHTYRHDKEDTEDFLAEVAPPAPAPTAPEADDGKDNDNDNDNDDDKEKKPTKTPTTVEELLEENKRLKRERNGFELEASRAVARYKHLESVLLGMKEDWALEHPASPTTIGATSSGATAMEVETDENGAAVASAQMPSAHTALAKASSTGKGAAFRRALFFEANLKAFLRIGALQFQVPAPPKVGDGAIPALIVNCEKGDYAAVAAQIAETAATGDTARVKQLFRFCDDGGWTVLHFLAECGTQDKLIAELVEKHGALADLSTKDLWGLQPLAIAAYAGHLETVKLIVKLGQTQKGWSIDAMANDESTAYALAMRNNQYEIAEFLVANHASRH